MEQKTAALLQPLSRQENNRMTQTNKYNWDKLFHDWSAVRGERTNYKWDEVILSKGKDKITYSSYSYLGAEGAYKYLVELPFDACQSLGNYMKDRVTTKEENNALDKLRELGVIE